MLSTGYTSVYRTESGQEGFLRVLKGRMHWNWGQVRTKWDGEVWLEKGTEDGTSFLLAWETRGMATMPLHEEGDTEGGKK